MALQMLAWALLPIVLNIALVSGIVPLSSVKRISSLPTIPNSFIIEVDALSSIQTNLTKVSLLVAS